VLSPEENYLSFLFVTNNDMMTIFSNSANFFTCTAPRLVLSYH